MGGRAAIKLTRRTVAALNVERGDKVFWDLDLAGFGVRVHATGRKVYFAQARIPGGLPRRAAIGPHTQITPETARREAAGIINRIRRGEVPLRSPTVEPTVADLADRFTKAHVKVNHRPGPVEAYDLLVDRYILPEVGDLPLTTWKRRRVTPIWPASRCGNLPCGSRTASRAISTRFGWSMQVGMLLGGVKEWD